MIEVQRDRSTPIEKVLAALSAYDVKQTKPNKWMARCPTHDDKTQSLSVEVGEDGKALLHCFTLNCTFEGIVAALGLTKADLFPQKEQRATSSRQQWTDPDAIYSYVNANEDLLHQTLRHQISATEKKFTQRRPDGRGKWIWKDVF